MLIPGPKCPGNLGLVLAADEPKEQGPRLRGVLPPSPCARALGCIALAWYLQFTSLGHVGCGFMAVLKPSLVTLDHTHSSTKTQPSNGPRLILQPLDSPFSLISVGKQNEIYFLSLGPDDFHSPLVGCYIV